MTIYGHIITDYVLLTQGTAGTERQKTYVPCNYVQISSYYIEIPRSCFVQGLTSIKSSQLVTIPDNACAKDSQLMRWSDFARFSARELCPLRQCNSTPTHHNWDDFHGYTLSLRPFPQRYIITGTNFHRDTSSPGPISTEIRHHRDRFPQRYVITGTDFHRDTPSLGPIV